MTSTTEHKGSPRIPRFKSYEEEADFWDHNSPEDFPHEFEDMDVEFVPSASGQTLSPEDRRKLIKTLSGLSDAERQALALMLLGLGASEITRIMGWSADQAKQALNDARRRMANLSYSSK